MAFNFGNTTAPARNNSNDTDWKADGFINIALPDGDGGFVKLGAIPLKCSDENQKRVYEWLNEDPSRVAKLLSACRVDFRPAQKKTVKFDLNALL